MSNPDYMEMPVPCQVCGEWFDLNDGYGSEKWYPNTVICETCHQLEESEIARDEEILELKTTIAESVYIIMESKKRLKELGYKESEAENE